MSTHLLCPAIKRQNSGIHRLCSSTYLDNRLHTVLVARKHLLLGKDTSHLAERSKKSRQVLHLSETNCERHFDWLTECCEKKMVILRDTDKCAPGEDLASQQPSSNIFLCNFIREYFTDINSQPQTCEVHVLMDQFVCFFRLFCPRRQGKISQSVNK